MERDGLNYYKDFEWAFGPNRICLGLVGLWPNVKMKEGPHVAVEDSKCLTLPVLQIILILGFLVPQYYALIQVYGNTDMMIQNLSINFFGTTTVIKLFLFWKSRRAYGSVLRSVLSDWAHSHNITWERNVMLKQAGRARILIFCGYSITCTSLINLLVLPLFGFQIRILNNITDSVDSRRPMPLQSSYPYDNTLTPYYELTYLSQLVSSSIASLCFTMPDQLFGVLVFHATAQCEILGGKVSQLIPWELGTSRCQSDRFFRVNLRNWVRQHVHIIRFVNSIENSFNLIILLHAVSFSFVTGLLGFASIDSIISEDKDLSYFQIATCIGLILSLAIYMLMYCVASEHLAQQSVEICDAIYFSNWYLLRTAQARDFIPILVRSRFPLQLSIGKFSYLSLNAFLIIMKSAVGYLYMFIAISTK